MMGSDIATDDSTAVAVDGLWDAGGFSGLVDTLREHAYHFNISMEHVINYGGLSGKVDTYCTVFLFSSAFWVHNKSFYDRIIVVGLPGRRLTTRVSL